jgi:hypothetical protein
VFGEEDAVKPQFLLILNLLQHLAVIVTGRLVALWIVIGNVE